MRTIDDRTPAISALRAHAETLQGEARDRVYATARACIERRWEDARGEASRSGSRVAVDVVSELHEAAT